MILLFNPFEKAYVKPHTRKGKRIEGYFTKRPPAKVEAKHTKKRFIDHDAKSADKAHKELEEKKRKHQVILQSLQNHHEKIRKEGHKDNSGLAHHEKLSHIQQEIENQKTHIENASRKQDLINNRYNILKNRSIDTTKNKENNMDKNPYKKLTDSELRDKAKYYDNLHNEGGSGFNPYRSEMDRRDIQAEKEYSRTPEGRREIILRKLGALDSSIARESGTYDENKIKELRMELKEIDTKLEAERNSAFLKKWPRDVTIKRREQWNNFVRPFIDADGKLKNKNNNMKIAKKLRDLGWALADLKRAVKLHQLDSP
jgi:hypothetical protein